MAIFNSYVSLPEGSIWDLLASPLQRIPSAYERFQVLSKIRNGLLAPPHLEKLWTDGLWMKIGKQSPPKIERCLVVIDIDDR